MIGLKHKQVIPVSGGQSWCCGQPPLGSTPRKQYVEPDCNAVHVALSLYRDQLELQGAEIPESGLAELTVSILLEFMDCSKAHCIIEGLCSMVRFLVALSEAL